MCQFQHLLRNSVEEIDQWRDEDGCKLSTIGMYRLRIKDMKSTKYLLVILSRLIRVDNNLEIVERKTPLGGNICLTDVSGNKGIFMPIAIIHHSGQVMGDVTWGHYQADVLDSKSSQWIRTSDDELPIKISEMELTDQGYIFLFKKIN